MLYSSFLLGPPPFSPFSLVSKDEAANAPIRYNIVLDARATIPLLAH